MAGAFHKEMGTYLETRNSFRRIRLGFKRRAVHLWKRCVDAYWYHWRNVCAFVIPQRTLPELRENMVEVFDRETSPFIEWFKRVFLRKTVKPESVDPELVEKSIEEGKIR